MAIGGESVTEKKLEAMKTITSFVQMCNSELKANIIHNIELIAQELEMYNTNFANESLYQYESTRDSRYFPRICHQYSSDSGPKRKIEFAKSSNYGHWLAGFDKFVMSAYNNTGEFSETNFNLRFKLDNLASFNSQTLGTLMLRRLIGFCKVRSIS